MEIKTMVSKKKRQQRGRIKDDDLVEARLWAETDLLLRGESDMARRFQALDANAAERLCYRPEEANREIVAWGCFVFVTRRVPTKPSPIPGCGYWAKPWATAHNGYDKRGRYSVQIMLPDGAAIRLWPYEYAVLPQDEIDGALKREELIYHPFDGAVVCFREMPEFGDLVGALQLDGMDLRQAVYELHSAGVEGAEIDLPARGWFEATFELPWI